MLTCDQIHMSQGDFMLRVNASFAEGALTAVIGASGAGKSTFLMGLAGFVPVVSGQLAFGGRGFTDAPPAKRPISMLFQDNNLFPHLTVAQNVGLGLLPRPRLTHAQNKAVVEMLDRVGLADLADRKPASLSGGQQSRVALARVLLADRQVVLLDEPFAALGPGLKDEMLDLMRQTLVKDAGATVLMVTHDPNDARRLADHVAWVADDRVAPPQPTTEIFANPPVGLRDYLGEMG